MSKLVKERWFISTHYNSIIEPKPIKKSQIALQPLTLFEFSKGNLIYNKNLFLFSQYGLFPNNIIFWFFII